MYVQILYLPKHNSEYCAESSYGLVCTHILKIGLEKYSNIKYPGSNLANYPGYPTKKKQTYYMYLLNF